MSFRPFTAARISERRSRLSSGGRPVAVHEKNLLAFQEWNQPGADAAAELAHESRLAHPRLAGHEHVMVFPLVEAAEHRLHQGVLSDRGLEPALLRQPGEVLRPAAGERQRRGGLLAFPAAEVGDAAVDVANQRVQVQPRLGRREAASRHALALRVEHGPQEEPLADHRGLVAGGQSAGGRQHVLQGLRKMDRVEAERARLRGGSPGDRPSERLAHHLRSAAETDLQADHLIGDPVGTLQKGQQQVRGTDAVGAERSRPFARRLEHGDRRAVEALQLQRAVVCKDRRQGGIIVGGAGQDADQGRGGGRQVHHAAECIAVFGTGIVEHRNPQRQQADRLTLRFPEGVAELVLHAIARRQRRQGVGVEVFPAELEELLVVGVADVRLDQPGNLRQRAARRQAALQRRGPIGMLLQARPQRQEEMPRLAPQAAGAGRDGQARRLHEDGGRFRLKAGRVEIAVLIKRIH
jgi:hypothetical protein